MYMGADKICFDLTLSCVYKAIHLTFIGRRPLVRSILPDMPEQELSYSIASGAKEDTVILHLTGPFTLTNMFQLQSELRSLKPARLIMDIAGVPYMDSAGLGVIMNYYVSAQNNGRRFYVCGMNERVRALLEMTKVDSVLHLRDSVEAAEAEV
jgi:anti-anti-sigma factor